MSAPAGAEAPGGGRWLAALAVGGIIPAVLLTDLLLAWAAGWSSNNSTADVLAVVCTALLVTLGVVAAVPRGRAWLSRMLFPWLALTISLTLAWTLAEVVAGQVYGGELLYHRHTPSTRSVFMPRDGGMPGVSDDAEYTTNSDGVRGSEFDASDRYRVLCIGGSTTACLFLDDEETWPQVLRQLCEERFDGRLWVGDVGKSGFGSWQHVRFMATEDLLEQVDCLVVLAGVNDFMRTLQGRRIARPVGVQPLFESSNLYAVAHNWYEARKQLRLHAQEFTDGRAYLRRRANRQGGTLTDETPDLDYGIAEFRANLEGIIERCEELGLRPILLTQPVLWRKDLPQDLEQLLWLGQTSSGSYLTVDALADGMDRFNQAIIDLCAEREVECVDLSSMNGNPDYFFDDCHFSEAGARRVAELLAPAFR